MSFEIRAGSRASIGRVEVDEIDGSGQAVAGGVPIRAGDPFDNDEILRELNRYVAQLHERGFYEARAVHSFTFEPDLHCHREGQHRPRPDSVDRVCRRSAAGGRS